MVVSFGGLPGCPLYGGLLRGAAWSHGGPLRGTAWLSLQGGSLGMSRLLAVHSDYLRCLKGILCGLGNVALVIFADLCLSSHRLAW